MTNDVVCYKRFRANDDANNNRITNATALPDELWIDILSYIDIVDVVHAFYNLNRRFQSLTQERAKNITVTRKITTWFQEYVPQLHNWIKTIYLSDTFARQIFNGEYSFQNLQVVVLKGNGWKTAIVLDGRPASLVVQSALYLFGMITYADPFETDIHILLDLNKDKILDDLWLLIRRLSIGYCNINTLLIILARTLNLIDLKVRLVGDIQYNNNLMNNITTSLVKLDITLNKYANIDLLKGLLNTCKTSLQKLKIHTIYLESIDGYSLESMIKPCEQLKKFVFFFVYRNEMPNLNNIRCSFQSKWWLDKHCPPVYIGYNDKNDQIITSIPSQFSFQFKGVFPTKWYFNKTVVNSSLIRFKNVNNIHITNGSDETVRLEDLYDIARIFTSSNQYLKIDYCNFELVDIIFDLLLEDSSITSVLPNINHFCIGLNNELGSLPLTVWFLLMTNLKILDISNLNTFNKTELAYELNTMLETNQSLKSNFHHIEKLILFQKCDNDEVAKHEMFKAFEKVFINAEIS